MSDSIHDATIKDWHKVMEPRINWGGAPGYVVIDEATDLTREDWETMTAYVLPVEDRPRPNPFARFGVVE